MTSWWLWPYTVILLIAIISKYLHATFTYWQRKKLPSYPSPSLLFGNLKSNLPETMTNVYKYFKALGEKHGGFYFFHQPIYVPIGVDLIKQILTTDFEYFTDKGFYDNEKHQPMNMHLFLVGGERWKKLRTKLTPTFTSGKLKQMFTTMADCTIPLVQTVEKHADHELDIDIKDIASKFTTDVIGSCAFGLECNSFAPASSEFHIVGKSNFLVTPMIQFKRAITMCFPRLCQWLGVVMIPKDAERFYTNITLETMQYRRENNIERNDFLQLLMNAQHRDDPKDRITTQEIINQSFIFYIAGYETSSSVMTFALLELARHPVLQDKLRLEITTTLRRFDDQMSYEAIQSMEYLGRVIDETMRMYPPLVILNRACSKDYHVPGTDVVLNAGTKVFIPVQPLQYDADYYPEPETFDPDRFTAENSKSRASHAYLPFGEGPRQCIGLRFGLLQTKIGLISLLRRFRFDVHASLEYPVKYSTNSLVLIPRETILLKTSKIV